MNAARRDRLYNLTQRLWPRIERGLDEGRDIRHLEARWLRLLDAYEAECRR